VEDLDATCFEPEISFIKKENEPEYFIPTEENDSDYCDANPNLQSTVSKFKNSRSKFSFKSKISNKKNLHYGILGPEG